MPRFLAPIAAMLLSAALLTGFGGPADAIEVYRAKTIQPYQAQSIKPYSAGSVQPYRAGSVRPHGGAGSIRVYQARPARLLTRAERERMMAKTSGSSRASGGGFSACAPNCGYNYSLGRSAPTIYSPFHNYSPYGN